jgi:hypothetical protein
LTSNIDKYIRSKHLKAKHMRVVVVTAALATVLAGCAPRDPAAYPQMVCAGQDGPARGSDEHVACVRFLAKNAPTALLALGGAMLEPVTAAPDGYAQQ